MIKFIQLLLATEDARCFHRKQFVFFFSRVCIHASCVWVDHSPEAKNEIIAKVICRLWTFLCTSCVYEVGNILMAFPIWNGQSVDVKWHWADKNNEPSKIIGKGKNPTLFIQASYLVNIIRLIWLVNWHNFHAFNLVYWKLDGDLNEKHNLLFFLFRFSVVLNLSIAKLTKPLQISCVHFYMLSPIQM